MGGTDTKLKHVVIKEIVANTPADIDGQLRPGDQILKVPNTCNYKPPWHMLWHIYI